MLCHNELFLLNSQQLLKQTCHGRYACSHIKSPIHFCIVLTNTRCNYLHSLLQAIALGVVILLRFQQQSLKKGLGGKKTSGSTHLKIHNMLHLPNYKTHVAIQQAIGMESQLELAEGIWIGTTVSFVPVQKQENLITMISEDQNHHCNRFSIKHCYITTS